MRGLHGVIEKSPLQKHSDECRVQILVHAVCLLVLVRDSEARDGAALGAVVRIVRVETAAHNTLHRNQVVVHRREGAVLWDGGWVVVAYATIGTRNVGVLIGELECHPAGTGC